MNSDKQTPFVLEAVEMTEGNIDKVLDFIYCPNWEKLFSERNFFHFTKKDGVVCTTPGGIDPSDGKFKITAIDEIVVVESGDMLARGCTGELYLKKANSDADPYCFRQPSVMELCPKFFAQ